MSDPLEQLDRFRSEVEGAPMLTAAEIRRRGDRMRRRGNALKTGVAALAVAAVIVPLSLNAGHGDHDSHVAKDVNPTPAPSALSQANLVRTADVTTSKGLSWEQTYSQPLSTQATATVCEAHPFPTFAGYSAGFERDWTEHDLQTGEPGDSYLDEVVVEFGSAEDATTAAATIKGWFDSCAPSGSTSYDPGTWQDISTGTGGTGQQMTAVYGPADAAPHSQFDVSGRSDLGWVLDVGIVVDGNRIAVLSHNVLTTVRGVPVPRSTVADDIPVTAERLIAGTPPTQAPGDPASTPGSPATSGGPTVSGGPISYPTTTIPAGFPLDHGWDESSPEGPDSIIAPSRTATLPELSTSCADPLQWPAHVDQLVAGFHNPEDYRDRTLVTFKDADAAVAATASIVDYFRACPQHDGDPQGYVNHYAVERSTLSGDSWQISQWNTYNGKPALGATSIHVIRVGLAVLVVSWGGEGGLEQMPDYFRQMNREAADSIAAMCAFTEAGC